MSSTRMLLVFVLGWIVGVIGMNIGRRLELLDPEQDKCSYQYIHPECEDGNNYEDDGSQWFNNPERWPYLVSIQLLRASGCFYHHCTGTLIAPDVVITAAACLTSVIPGIQDKDEAHLVTSVYAARAPSCRHQGSEQRSKIIYYKLNDSRIDRQSVADKDNEQDQQVKQIDQHPLGLKLALLKLQVPLLQENLPSLGSSGFPGGSLLAVGEVAGWGNVFDESSQAAVQQQKIADYDYSGQFGVGGHPGEYEVHPLQGDYVIVINGNDGRCQKMLEGLSGSWWPEVGMEGLLCAYANSSYTACGAEIGGPLIQTDLAGVPREGVQLALQGICAYIPPELCSPNFPEYHGYFLGVYLDVSLFVDWIAETLVQFEGLFIEKYLETEDAIGLDIVDKQESCSTTGMCKCKKLWQFNGLPNNDCTNPDADSRGSWCIVQENSCKGSPAGTVTITGESWDRCTCDTSSNNNVVEIIDQYVQEFDQDFPTRIVWLPPEEQTPDNSSTSEETNSLQEATETKADTEDCSLTRNGCRCLSQWQHDGQEHSFCANPDDDIQGPWCYIDVEQYNQEGIQKACWNLDGFLFNNQVVTDENGDVVAYFDYCRSECL